MRTAVLAHVNRSVALEAPRHNAHVGSMTRHGSRSTHGSSGGESMTQRVPPAARPSFKTARNEVLMSFPGRVAHRRSFPASLARRRLVYPVIPFRSPLVWCYSVIRLFCRAPSVSRARRACPTARSPCATVGHPAARGFSLAGEPATRPSRPSTIHQHRRN